MKVERTIRTCAIVPRHCGSVFALLMSLLLLVRTSSFAENPEVDVDIPSQEVGKALESFAEQTNTSLMFSSDDVGKIPSKAVTGRYTQDQALRIMLEDTGLVFKRTSGNTFSVQKAPKKLGLRSRLDLSGTDMRVENKRNTTRAGEQPLFLVQADTGKPDHSPKAMAVEEKRVGEKKAVGKEVFTLEEIVVTATKREESILEVPLSMTAFNDKKIEALGITNTNDLEQLTPGLQFGDDNEAVGQGTVIRGIGSRWHGETHTDLAVATYVDGVYTYSAYGVSPNLFDIERVEVARGPQGTLHGRNSIAGSISFFHKEPTDEWDADILVEVTDQWTQRYNVAFGGPIFDGLLFRITGGYYDGDGAQKNIGLSENYDAPHQESFAPQLRFKTDRLDISFRYSWTKDDGSPRTQVVLGAFDRVNPTNPLPFGGRNGSYLYPEEETEPAIDDCSPGEPINQCSDLNNVLNLNAPGIQESTREAYALNADYDITEGLTLRYTVGWSDVEAMASRDQDGMNRAYGGYNGDPLLIADSFPLFDRRLRSTLGVGQYSHEFQLLSDFEGPFNLIAGVFYYENTTHWVHSIDDFASTFRFRDTATEFQLANADVADVFNSFGIPSPVEGWDTCGELAQAISDVFHDGYPIECPPGSDHMHMYSEQTQAHSETKAAFAHMDYRISDVLLVSGGLRYTKDKKKQGGLNSGWQIFNGHDVYVPFFDINLPMLYRWDSGTRGFDTWDAWIWNVSAEFTPSGNTMYYGRISTGYRAGGFNAVNTDWKPPKVDEETLVNYEIGVKSLSMDQRILFTGSAFYSTYEGFQMSALQGYPQGFVIPGAAASPLIEYTANIDGTTLWGLELEGSYFLTEDLQFSGYYAYLDSELGRHASVSRADPDQHYACFRDGELTAVDCGALPQNIPFPADMTGNQLAMQPKHKFALTMAYTMPLPNVSKSYLYLGSLEFLSTYSYTGERHPEIANIPSQIMRGYSRWDIRAHWTSVSGRWSAGVFVQNVLDDIGLIAYLPVNPNTKVLPPTGTPTEPRRVGTYVRWKL